MRSAHDTSEEYGAGAVVAVVASGAMIAEQVAGKAVRDALFLSNHPASRLPAMVMGAALLSLVTMALMVHLLRRFGPRRVVAPAFVVSALLLVVVAWTARWAPGLGAVLLYLHIGALGAVLISGFWSVVSERFDPRTARGTIGRVSLGGTVGGLVGGLGALGVADRVGAPVVVTAMAALHVACAPLVYALRPVSGAPPGSRRSPGDGDDSRLYATARRAASQPYLVATAALVLVVTCAEAFVDFVFKSQAQARIVDQAELLRFFALFYASTGVLTFVFQAAFGRRLLERFGILPALAALPATVSAVAALAAVVPGLVTAALARGVEAVLHSSAYRSAYELLYVPMPRRDKRATKPLIDVGVDRLGSALGAGLVGVALVAFGRSASIVLLVAAALLSVLGLRLAVRLRAGYVGALEGRMVERALELDLDGPSEDGGPGAVLLTLADIDLRRTLPGGVPALAHAEASVTEPVPLPAESAGTDAAESLPAAVASADERRVRELLASDEAWDLAAVDRLVSLLAWDAVAPDVIVALRRKADDATDALVAALLSPEQDFAVRRRVPRVLSRATNERALSGLVRGLDDPRFEVRFQCGQALRHLVAVAPAEPPAREGLLRHVARELDVDRDVWSSYRLIDDESALRACDDAPLFEDVLRARSSRALQHVFTLLAVAYPRGEVATAYAVLGSDDPTLRGTALEYLETLLPAWLHRRLMPRLEDRSQFAQAAPPRGAALRALLDASRSLQVVVAPERRSE